MCVIKLVCPEHLPVNIITYIHVVADQVLLILYALKLLPLDWSIPMQAK